jgi:hypothetical protein
MTYLPISVKIAAPRARIPISTAGIPGRNVESPYRRKNSIVHQAAIELGILIFILLWEKLEGSASLLSE